MNIEKINNQYAFLFESACQGFEPSKFHENKMSTTLIPNGTPLALLNPILFGFLTTHPPGDLIEVRKDHSGVILRGMLSYAAAARIENNFGLGCLVLSQLINAMLYEAYRYHPHMLSDFKKITFDRPDIKNSFFRELENLAGYELRLYIEF